MAYLVPPAVRAGHVQEITLHGRNLQDVTGLLADVPLAVQVLERSPAQARFRVTASQDTWPGIHQLRAVTVQTVSAPRLFVVDDLPLIAQMSSNHSFAEAQMLVLPAAVVAQTSQAKEDYYRLRLAAPASLTFEIVAARLGAGPPVTLGGDEAGRLVTIDPVLRILDANGRELALADDTPGLTADLRLRYHFERAGEYTIVVHDVQYHGGPEHQYVLRIGDFPDAAVCYPAGGGPAEIVTGVKLYTAGPAAESFAPAVVTTSDAQLDSVHWVSARSRSGLQSLAVPHWLGHLPEASEVEPNDTAQIASRLSWPVTCNGRLQSPGDVDHFAVELRKEQKLRLTLRARTLGSTVWPGVRVLAADGKQMASMVQDGSQDPWGAATDPRLDLAPLTFTAPADGRHVIQVHRRLGRAGPAAVYRLDIEPFTGSYTLWAKSDFLAVPRGGTGVLAVDVMRESYDGPVDVTSWSSLASLPASRCRVSGSQASRTLVTLTAPADHGETVGWLVVTGRAPMGDQTVHRTAELTKLYDPPGGTPANQGHFFFLRPLPPVVLRRIPVLVTEPAPFALQSSEALSATAGDTVTVPVRCVRTRGFENAVVLRVEGLPEKVTVNAPSIAPGQDSAAVQLNLPDKLAPGNYVLAVVGEATAQGRKRINSTPILTLAVRSK